MIGRTKAADSGQIHHQLRAMQRLHEVGTALLLNTDLHLALDKILGAVLELLEAERGTAQLLDPKQGRLQTVAQRGFPDNVAPHCVPRRSRDQAKDDTHCVDDTGTGSGSASGTQTCESLRSIQLYSRNGVLLGCLTVCHDRPFQPNLLQLRMLDLYAQQASAFIEHIQVQQALRGTEAYLSALFTHAPVGLSELSLDGRFLRVNRALCTMLGRTEQEILGNPSSDFTDPADIAASAAALAQVQRTGKVVSLDKHYLCADGTRVPANSILNLLRDDWGGPRSVLVVTVDLTNRKRAEAALRKSEERYRTLFESIDEGFLLLDPVFDDAGAGVDADGQAVEPIDYCITEVNPAFSKQTGLSAVTGKTVREIAKGYEDFWIRFYGRVYAGGNSERMLLHSRQLDRWLSVNAFVTGRENRRRIAALFSDVTEQKRIQDELAISNERLKLAVEGAGDGIWDWDLVTDRIMVSPRWSSLLGYGDVEVAIDVWESRMHPEDHDRVMADARSCIAGEIPSFDSEFRLRRESGDYIWVLARGVVVLRDGDGTPQRMTGMISDISRRKEADDLIWRHANFDALTNLPNRRLFKDRLEQEVRKAQRAGTRFALLFIDLDRFKQVNDLLGHDIGDQLLLQAAQRLKSCVRESDTVARLGGDEFTVILSQLEGPAHVEQVSQKILDALSRPFALGREISYLSGSIGVTLYPADATTTEELIRKADQAMYAAKNGGKNRFSYFTESMDKAAHLRLKLASELHSALEQQQFEVHYQPVVDLESGMIAKAEALLRWRHPRLGTVLPSEFIPVAEESGAINEIGDWVFREAARSSLKWGRQIGRPFQIGVNRSPAQFLSRTGEDPVECLRQLGLSGSSISVEITEGLLLHGSERVSDRLLEFRDAGVQVAIDDFGTGYSSMAYLKRFDIDYLKIDQSFIADMASDDTSRAIAESIIVMAHRLGLKVIAEGIETARQRDLLRAAGCDYGQGYFFSRAVPGAMFEQMLVSGTAVAAQRS